jgi:hypothetical protein
LRRITLIFILIEALPQLNVRQIPAVLCFPDWQEQPVLHFEPQTKEPVQLRVHIPCLVHPTVMNSVHNRFSFLFPLMKQVNMSQYKKEDFIEKKHRLFLKGQYAIVQW